MTAVTELVHGRVRLALHALRETQGCALLLLHGLGERSPEKVPPELESWPGPIAALDFTGHGASTLPPSGGYTCELLLADADAALAHLRRATVLGRGLGAYVALLLAGARPAAVRGAILCDGPGLAGGGPTLLPPSIQVPPLGGERPPDPFAKVELGQDVRPPDYALQFCAQATALSGLPRPIHVCAEARPAWLAALVEEPGVAVGSLDAALATYA